MMDVNNQKYYELMGKRLKRFRNDLKLTLTDVGSIIGHSATLIQSIESGQKKPSFDLLLKFQTVYRKSITAMVNTDFMIQNSVNKQRQASTWSDAITLIEELQPVEIPVYKQSTFCNPDAKPTDIGGSGDEPFDHILWSKYKFENRGYNNSKIDWHSSPPIFIVQIQTTNLYPHFNVNDRICFEKVPFEELPQYGSSIICLGNDGKPRRDFNNTKGCRIVRADVVGSYDEAKQGGMIYKNNGMDDFANLKEKDYLGIGIQTIRSISNLQEHSSFEQIEEHSRLRNVA